MVDVNNNGFLRIYQILGCKRRWIAPLLPIGKSVWWKGVRTGKFPKSIKLGPRTTVWKTEDIIALINSFK